MKSVSYFRWGSLFKASILELAYRLSPFQIAGDGWFPDKQGKKVRISCIINFYGRLDLLCGIMHSLVEQKYPRNFFEVILIEDRGGTEEGKAFCESFADRLDVKYWPLDKNYSNMGYSRNFGLARASGQYVLFLDDDTVILQKNFLNQLEKTFLSHTESDAILPRGRASHALWPERYDYHEAYFPTSRCTAYRYSVLKELGGFMNCFAGQEDVEFVIRFIITGKKALAVPCLEYFHPPLMIPNLKKPEAVGVSFARLRGRYSTLFLLLSAMNCGRHVILLMSPLKHHREMGRFGLGFLRGFTKALFTSQTTARYS